MERVTIDKFAAWLDALKLAAWLDALGRTVEPRVRRDDRAAETGHRVMAP